MTKSGVREPFWECTCEDGARIAQLPSWGIRGTGSTLRGEGFCVPEHFRNPDRPDRSAVPVAVGPGLRPARARGVRGTLACPRQNGWALGVPGVRVWLGVHGVLGLCVFWPPGGRQTRGPAGREHTALSALTKPLCVARGVVVAVWLVGRSKGASTSTEAGGGRGCKAFPLWTHPDLLIPLRLWGQPRLSLQHSSFSYSQKRSRTTLCRSPGMAGRLWVEPILVSVGIGS